MTESADRRHRDVAVVTIGLFAVTLGWALGRGSAGDDVGATPSTTASRSSLLRPIATVGPTTGGGSVVAVPSAPPPTSAGPTDAAVDAAHSVTVDVTDALAGRPIEIVAVGEGRRLVRLDVASGRLTSRPLSGQPFGRLRLVLGEDWILLPSAEPTLPSTLVDARGERDWDAGDGFRVVDGLAGRLWRTPTDHPAHHLFAFEPISIDGEPIGPPIALFDEPVGSDPRGGFVVAAPGGTYSVGSEGSARITTGTLLALGVDGALADECDATLACAAVLIDRTTGDRRPVDLPRRTSIESLAGSSLSPDNGAAIVRSTDPRAPSPQQILAMVDLDAGGVTEIGPVQDIDQATWTPDGELVLFVNGGRLMVFDRRAGTTAAVADELIAIETFAVRRRP